MVDCNARLGSIKPLKLCYDGFISRFLLLELSMLRIMRPALGFGLLLQVFSVIFANASLPDTIKKIEPSIVGVGSFNPLATPRVQLKGTGFAIKNGRQVVTNFHVVAPILAEDSSKVVIMVGTGPKAQVFSAKLEAQKEEYDLAVLSFEGKALPTLKLSQRTLEEGEQIAFTGFPIGAVLGLYPVTHRGIISSVTPVAVPANTAKGLTADVVRRLRNPYFVYQLDATAYPGNSGSPLYDQATGEVVGVINKVFVKRSKEAVLSDPSGITYAIPAKFVKELLDEL